MFFQNHKQKKQHELDSTKSPHFPPEGKIGQLGKKKRALCWGVRPLNQRTLHQRVLDQRTLDQRALDQ